jgi:putative membrane protein
VAFVLGLRKATLRPMLGFIAFPITLITLGLFAIVLNAAICFSLLSLSKDSMLGKL